MIRSRVIWHTVGFLRFQWQSVGDFLLYRWCAKKSWYITPFVSRWWVQCVCVCALGWLKSRAQIQSIFGHHIWLHVKSLTEESLMWIFWSLLGWSYCAFSWITWAFVLLRILKTYI